MNLSATRTLALFFLLFPATACFGQTVYEVEGTNYGPDGKGMANVVLSLQNHAGVQIDQDITKSDGRYHFAGVITGTYYLSVKPPDQSVQTVVQKIELINSGVSISNFSKERFDFSLKSLTRSLVPPATIFAQVAPPDAEKAYQTALGNISKDDKESAVKDLKRALEIFPNYFLALQQLGLLYIDLEKDEEAIKPLNKAIQV